MSTFSVKVCKIRDIEPIANADAIELAVIGDYRSIVKKGEYKAGDLAVFIPPNSIVPEWILKQLNLWDYENHKGKLASKTGNRVKEIRLRGVLSEGLIFSLKHTSSMNFYLMLEDGSEIPVKEGDDVAEVLGIVKWEPPIPATFAGEVYNAGRDLTIAYDIENFKNFPDVLQIGEEVVMTEKLHGTFCAIGILPNKDWNEDHIRTKFVVFSKGLGSKGLCFKDNIKNQDNVYIKTLTELQIFEKLESFVNMIKNDGGVIDSPTFILGEVIGKGVQDLSYNVDKRDFRAFDMVVGYRGKQLYYDYDDMVQACMAMGINSVPLIYRGPFSREVMLQHTSGKETISGKNLHVREGVVVKPVKERTHIELGRVILKSVNEDYLLRKGGTEYN
jgi:RNA ligase (TIGR02306 family)